MISWLSGGVEAGYMTIVHCMRSDWFWLSLMLLFNSLIVFGYLEFAKKNYQAYRQVKDKSCAARAYMSLVWVFLLCAICGYMSSIVYILWPVKRLFIIFSGFLAFFTWRLIFTAKEIDFYHKIFRK